MQKIDCPKVYSRPGVCDLRLAKLTGMVLFIFLPAITPLLVTAQESFSYPFFKGSVSGNLEELAVNAVAGGMFSNSFLKASASLGFLNEGQSGAVRLDAAWAEYNHSWQWYFKLGYFSEQASAATIFPLLDVFQARLFSDTVRWGGAVVPDSNTLAQFRFVRGAFSFKANCNPFEPQWSVMRIDDHFFPSDIIPLELDLGSFLGIYTLNDLDLEAPDWSSFDIRPIPEFSLEASWQGSALDARLIYFQGADRSVALQPFISLNTYPYATYDFSLVPIRSDVSILGASMTLPVKEFTFFTEIAYTWNDLLISGTRKIVDLKMTFPAVSVDHVEISSGTMWSMPWLPIRFVAEGRYAWLTRADEDLDLETLSRAASMAMEWTMFSEALVLSPLALVSLKDGSQAYSVKATWSVHTGFKIWALWMHCNGDPGSELGRYRESDILRLGVDWAM